AKHFLRLLLLLLPLTVQASGEASVSALADRVQSLYEGAQDLSMDFDQRTYVAVLEKEVRKKGSARFKKPGKMAIRYEGEGGRNYLSDGKTLWIFESGDAQVQKMDVGETDMPAEALSFLGGLGRLQRDFAVETVDSKKWKSLKRKRQDLSWMELTPLNKQSGLAWLVMGFDGGNVAREVFLSTDTGNLSHYTLENVTLNQGLSDDLFKYSKK
ncbi:MAG TPA: outer membrane lipoprotein carrier protein LolA, partial [bacterium]|nr:outer membrane lipoprotein carrier protein LolA [bacterium]